MTLLLLLLLGIGTRLLAVHGLDAVSRPMPKQDDVHPQAGNRRMGAVSAKRDKRYSRLPMPAKKRSVRRKTVQSTAGARLIQRISTVDTDRRRKSVRRVASVSDAVASQAGASSSRLSHVLEEPSLDAEPVHQSGPDLLTIPTPTPSPTETTMTSTTTFSGLLTPPSRLDTELALEVARASPSELQQALELLDVATDVQHCGHIKAVLQAPLLPASFVMSPDAAVFGTVYAEYLDQLTRAFRLWLQPSPTSCQRPSLALPSFGPAVDYGAFLGHFCAYLSNTILPVDARLSAEQQQCILNIFSSSQLGLHDDPGNPSGRDFLDILVSIQSDFMLSKLSEDFFKSSYACQVGLNI